MRILATLSIALVAPPAFHTSTKPLPPKVLSEVKARPGTRAARRRSPTSAC